MNAYIDRDDDNDNNVNGNNNNYYFLPVTFFRENIREQGFNRLRVLGKVPVDWIEISSIWILGNDDDDDVISIVEVNSVALFTFL